MPEPANSDQAEFWSGPAGRKWATHQQRLDHLFSEATAAILERAAPKPDESVLDIGCGTGGLALAAADAVAPGGTVLGVDISTPLLALARLRAGARTNLDFIEADAQTHAFPPDNDLVISRFGVMFFADSLAAFRNITAALKPGGRVTLAAWAPMRDNPWSWIARDAGVAHLGPPPDETPGRAGQFAWAIPAPVVRTLTGAGLSDVTAETLDIRLLFAGTPAEAAALATSIGPVSRIMQTHNGSPDDLAAINEAVAAALEPYAANGQVAVPARINIFTARR